VVETVIGFVVGQKPEGNPTMTRTRLTAKFVERSKQPGRWPDGDVKCLYLQIDKSGAKSWVFRYERDGEETMMGLGSLKDVTWKEAREDARAQRLLLRDGVDPLQAKRDRKAAAKLVAARILTFAVAADRYAEQHSVKWRNDTHRLQFSSSLERYANPILGAMDVAKIETADVLRVIEPIWTTKAVTADRVRRRIAAVLDWCVVRGHRPTGTNPAKWRGHLDQVLPATRSVAPVTSHAALDYTALPAFMQALRNEEGSAARALEFTILTAARLGEVIGARWDEIRFDDPLYGAVWVVPASRMKARRQHTVPLAPEVVRLLRALPQEADNPFLFVGSRQGSGLGKMSIQYLIRSLHSSATTHGMRAVFRRWAGEMTSAPREACELALAHTVGSSTEQAYARGSLLQKRIKLMQAWTKFATTPPISQGDNVTPLRAVE
jgi:integrase